MTGAPPSAGARSRAPGRVNLIGEHTDYNDGFVLPFAIEQGCTVDIGRTAGEPITIESAQRGDRVVLTQDQLQPAARWIKGADGWAAYAAGVAWALVARGHLKSLPTGIDIALDSDVPIGAGLSSSAAVGCAVAVGLNQLYGLGLTQAELAAVATTGETEFVGAPTGGMDQLASIHCQEGHVLFCDMRSLAVEPVPFDLRNNGLQLLVVDSRAPHQLVDGEYRERRQSCEQSAKELGVPALRDITSADLDAALERLPNEVLRRRTRHVVTENARVRRTVELLRDGRIRDIGPVLLESHTSMREDFEITIPEIDVAVDALMAAGSLGARMTGGGFGGCVIALVETAGVASSVAAVMGAYDHHRFGAPSWFVSRPGPGARVL